MRPDRAMLANAGLDADRHERSSATTSQEVRPAVAHVGRRTRLENREGNRPIPGYAWHAVRACLREPRTGWIRYGTRAPGHSDAVIALSVALHELDATSTRTNHPSFRRYASECDNPVDSILMPTRIAIDQP